MCVSIPSSIRSFFLESVVRLDALAISPDEDATIVSALHQLHHLCLQDDLCAGRIVSSLRMNTPRLRSVRLHGRYDGACFLYSPPCEAVPIHDTFLAGEKSRRIPGIE